MNHHENGNDTNNSDFEQPMSNPSDSEYTYEGAIQDYKSRISRQTSNQFVEHKAKCQTITPEKPCYKVSAQRDLKIMKTQEQLFASNGGNNQQQAGDNKESNNINLPKIDISKKKELFEKTTTPNHKYTNDEQTKINITSPIHRAQNHQQSKISPKVTEYFQNAKSIKERLSSLGQKDEQHVDCKEERIVPENVTTLKDRLSSLEKQCSVTEPKPVAKIDMPIPSIKDRLSSLHSNITPANEAVTRDEPVIVPQKINPKVATLEERNNKINLNGNHHVQGSVTQNSNLVATNNTALNNHCDLVRSTSGSGERCVILEFNGYSRQSSHDSCPKSPQMQPKGEVKIEPKIESFADEEKMVEEKFQEISSALKMEMPVGVEEVRSQHKSGTFESCNLPEQVVGGGDDHETSVSEHLLLIL